MCTFPRFRLLVLFFCLAMITAVVHSLAAVEYVSNVGCRLLDVPPDFSNGMVGRPNLNDDVGHEDLVFNRKDHWVSAVGRQRCCRWEAAK